MDTESFHEPRGRLGTGQGHLRRTLQMGRWKTGTRGQPGRPLRNKGCVPALHTHRCSALEPPSANPNPSGWASPPHCCSPQDPKVLTPGALSPGLMFSSVGTGPEPFPVSRVDSCISARTQNLLVPSRRILRPALGSRFQAVTKQELSLCLSIRRASGVPSVLQPGPRGLWLPRAPGLSPLPLCP